MKHFLPIFKALKEAKVNYVTVGGIATVLHGYPRLTADIDLILDLSKANCLKAVEAFSAIGFQPRIPVSFQDFAEPENRQSWVSEKGLRVFSLSSPRYPLLEVDLFIEEPIPFEELNERAVLVEIEDCPICVASIDDIITLKRKAGRPKDLADIEALEIIKENAKS